MIIRTGGFEAKNLKPKGHEVNCMPDIKLQFFFVSYKEFVKHFQVIAGMMKIGFYTDFSAKMGKMMVVMDKSRKINSEATLLVLIRNYLSMN